MGKKRLKTGVRRGGGPPPGYEWNVVWEDKAGSEIRKAFESHVVEHLISQMKDLASHTDPTHSATLSIRQIENFWELREKSGGTGGVNTRIFFGIDSTQRNIVVLGGIVKQNHGPTPLGAKRRMQRRWREYKDES